MNDDSRAWSAGPTPSTASSGQGDGGLGATAVRSTQRRRLKLLNRRELEVALRPAWLVKGILPQAGLAVCYGASGAGKSFLMLDLACAIAEGAEWFGRTTKRAPVAYLCLEGAPGFASRVRAWEVARKRTMPELLGVIAQPFRLHDPEDVALLLEAIAEFQLGLPSGLPPPVVVVDTLNRATAGSDENSSTAMGETIAGSTHISDATRGLVILAHHSGKDAERGMRGHTSLASAADAVLLVARSGAERRWVAEKVKEGQDGLSANFELETLVIGVDEDGEDITSCVVKPGEVTNRATNALPAALDAGMRALKKGMPTEAADSDAGPTEATWREALLESCTAASPSGRRNAVARARSAMLAAGYVTDAGGHLIPTREGREVLSRM